MDHYTLSQRALRVPASLVFGGGRGPRRTRFIGKP